MEELVMRAYRMNPVTLVIILCLAGGISVFAVLPQSSTEQPAVITAVAPTFPPMAVASNTSGRAVIEVEVNAAGEVISTHIVDGHPLFRQTTNFMESVARRWRFAPATNGADVRTAKLTFIFSIVPKGTPESERTPVFTPPYQVEVKHLPFEPVVDSDPPSRVLPRRRRSN
jgi:TonB family protein